ncbi:hypothetical protein DERF_000337 [Dermatophagoides farinae]|uniref:Uncharacterized protein n=1 Tax=Dermatophagoides farinae TaxID=6954 RepID=A0A922I9Q7_DERFA|nr:hypothetical protein DERF_000337 [Dermatophagoides farinae]
MVGYLDALELSNSISSKKKDAFTTTTTNDDWGHTRAINVASQIKNLLDAVFRAMFTYGPGNSVENMLTSERQLCMLPNTSESYLTQ